MAAKTMIILNLARFPAKGSNDKLNFEPGVNVIVGPPNTGKTQWLKILDHLLGDDSPANQTFAEEVFEKYEYAELTASIAGREFSIKRYWKDPALRSKIIIDGNQLSKADFYDEIQRLLDLPPVHYPQGDPYGSRTWPELGWRSLFRHIYRRQQFWTDLADLQPESEQHACIMQFLGIAKDLFSREYGELIQSGKKIQELKLKREHFLSMLQEISRELVDAEGLGIALTPESIKSVSERMRNEVSDLHEKRITVLNSLLNSVSPNAEPNAKEIVQILGEELATIQSKREIMLSNIKKVDDRRFEMIEYGHLVAEELSRLKRAEHASGILTAIRITHCPACDREITPHSSGSNECLLCHRPIQLRPETNSDSTQRIEFEIRQLSAEYNETQELITQLGNEYEEIRIQIQKLNERIQQIQIDLRPTRTAVAAIMPPEIALYDMEIGRFEERIQQIERISSSLRKREAISTEIIQIQGQVGELEKKVSEQYSRIDFERESIILADGMNSYLNLIFSKKPMLWSQKPVTISFHKKYFRFFVGDRDWRSKLGGTATLVFLMAYHYGLLGLTSKKSYNYPGLLILDFPAELDDGSIMRDHENFVLEPFVDFIRQTGMDDLQVIASGSAFENLANANRIELSRVWV
jgi:hypothetical protein